MTTAAAATSTAQHTPATAAIAQRWALIGAVVNTVLATLKIGAGIFGHSYALIADGIESGLDVTASLILWAALQYAARSPDEEHPYGHGKAEPISAMLVAAALCAAAVVLAIFSLHAIFFVPEREVPAWHTLWVLLVVVAVKETMFRRVVRVGEELASTAVRGDAWHHRADAITSLAAFIGILIAHLGGPGWEKADSWAAFFACLIIGFNGYKLLLPAVAEIMDTAPQPEVSGRVREAAAAVKGVAEVEKCRVRKMGLEYYVDLHVAVDGSKSVAEGHHIAHVVKDAVRAADGRIVDVLVHVEPANLCYYPGTDPAKNAG
jgi:cation diffusion facilitator family transporter